MAKSIACQPDASATARLRTVVSIVLVVPALSRDPKLLAVLRRNAREGHCTLDGFRLLMRNCASGPGRRYVCACSFSRQLCPRLAKYPPFKTKDAGKTGCALHPRSRVQLCTGNAHTSIQVQRKHSGLPCAMVLRLIRALPGMATLPPSPPRGVSLPTTYAIIRASGPHDFAVRESSVRFRQSPVHRIPPRVRDVRERPFWWDGIGTISR